MDDALISLPTLKFSVLDHKGSSVILADDWRTENFFGDFKIKNIFY
jgi:hypothetical protein